MDAGLLGRLINPNTQNVLNNLFSRITVAGSGNESPVPAETADSTRLGAAAASPTRVLNSEILRSLDQALSTNGGSGLDRSAGSDAYSPEKVAERVLGFIRSVVGQEPDAGRQGELLTQARAGVEKGFAQARDILDGLGVLQGDIAANINRTYDLIQNGLDKLASNGSGDASPAVPGASETGGAVTQAGFASASYTTSQSTSLVVKTLEGDTVTINISKQATSSRTQVAAAAGDSGFSATQNSREARVSFSFSVEGDLNKDEQKAIGALIKRIDKVSDKFFDGKVQSAFDTATRLRFDSKELAGYALNLRSSQTYRAVAAYQPSQQPATVPATAVPAATAPTATAPATGSLGDAAALGGEVRGLIDNAAATTPLAEPARTVADIFTTLTNERASAFGIDALKSDALSLLHDLVGHIVDGYKAPRATPQEDETHEPDDSKREEAAESA